MPSRRFRSKAVTERPVNAAACPLVNPRGVIVVGTDLRRFVETTGGASRGFFALPGGDKTKQRLVTTFPPSRSHLLTMTASAMRPTHSGVVAQSHAMIS